MRDEDGALILEEGMEKVLGLGEERQRIALEELALRTHLRQRQANPAARRPRPAYRPTSRWVMCSKCSISRCRTI